MATKIELFNQLKIDIAKGEGQHSVHMVDHVKEDERKRTNPQKSTRVMLNCRTPEQWREFQMAKERFFVIAVDPHIAIDLMVRALNHVDDAGIRAWLSSGHETNLTQPPRAEIPEWAK